MNKSIFILLFGLFSGLSVFGQAAAQGMKYQAVARDQKGKILAARPVNLQISLLSNEEPFYTENHFPTTNALGLFDLTIGAGKKVAGDFAKIPWATGDVWLEIKMDSDGSGVFQTVHSSRLLAVPYAFHAATAGEIADGSATGEPSPEACSPGSVTGTLWSTGSNCGTPATAKLGTADYKPLRFVTDGEERMVIFPDGKISVREDLTLDKDLVIDDQGTIGRVHITGANDGDGDDFESFSLQMDGSSQGAAIKIDGDVSGDHVFLACFDDGGLKGSVSGQTQSELYTSAEYILQHAHYVWATAQLAADIVGLGAEAAGMDAEVALVAQSVAVLAQAAGVGVAAADLAAEWIEFGVIQDQSVDGIVLNSGAADYAEWLERADPSADFFPGQIVGVKGGKISLETKGADHVMAISTAPVVLGNMPPAGREKAFEKVAFMGQVPVQVVGKVEVGDFILPSGNSDGYAIAVSPKNIKIEAYDRIIGVAWEASTGSISSLINVAIGINKNDLADEVAKQGRQVARLEEQMREVQAFLKGETKTLGNGNPIEKAPGASAAPVADVSKIGSRPSFGYSAEFLEKNGPAIEAKFNELIADFSRRGLQLEKIPAEAKAMLDDPIQALRDLESGKYGRTYTEQLYKNQAARKAAARAGK